MRKPRLLIVDDSVVIRRDLTAVLSREPDVEVVGSASSGRIALMKIPLLLPDVVLLDIDMPEMSGLDTLSAIRQLSPRLPVVILNVATVLAAAATVDALTLGANSYVMKPDAAVPSPDSVAALADDILSKLQQCCPGYSREPRTRKS